jgi:hypothetical protein
VGLTVSHTKQQRTKTTLAAWTRWNGEKTAFYVELETAVVLNEYGCRRKLIAVAGSMSTKVVRHPRNTEMVAGERIWTRHRSWNASLRLLFRNVEPNRRADELVPHSYSGAELPEFKKVSQTGSDPVLCT